jgi:hypothetical protein
VLSDEAFAVDSYDCDEECEKHGLSQYLLLLLNILKTVYRPSNVSAAGIVDGSVAAAPETSRSRPSPLAGFSPRGQRFEFDGAAEGLGRGNAVIGIITATFPDFWLKFIRDPVSCHMMSDAKAVTHVSYLLSSLNAPVPPAILSHLLLALKHHAHVRGIVFPSFLLFFFLTNCAWSLEYLLS